MSSFIAARTRDSAGEQGRGPPSGALWLCDGHGEVRGQGRAVFRQDADELLRHERLRSARDLGVGERRAGMRKYRNLRCSDPSERKRTGNRC